MNDNHNVHLVFTDASDRDFMALVRKLDADLVNRYGAKTQAEYSPHNAVQNINDVVVVYLHDKPIACGAFKPYDAETVEMKRVYVDPDARGFGYAKLLLKALEQRAVAQGFTKAVLETGELQQEAVALYYGLGYTDIPLYGPYIGLKHSVCMGKNLA